MRFTDEELDFLARVCCCSIGGTYVDSESIIMAGKMMERGLAQAEDDYEGPILRPTQSGIDKALKYGLIEPDEEWGGYMRVKSTA